MKHKIIFAAAAFLLSTGAAFSQAAADTTTAARFLALAGKGEDKEAWNLFDHKNVPNVTAEQFCALTEKYVRELTQFDTPVFEGQDSTFMSGKKLNVYFFDAAGTEKYAGHHATIQVFFVDGSSSIAGLRWQAAANPGL